MGEASTRSLTGHWDISMQETISADLAVFDSLVPKGAGMPCHGMPNFFSADIVFACNEVLTTPFFL